MTNKPSDAEGPDTNSFNEQAIQRVRDLLVATPEKIGPYRIIERLGTGGMGEVYRADQKEPLRRQVAIKLIKLGMDTKQVVSRIEAERQALAMMDHPNIARVFDGGTTEDGRPYFVMEYVKGKPITEYADINLLSIEDRLSLFEQLSDAYLPKPVPRLDNLWVVPRTSVPMNPKVDGFPDPYGDSSHESEGFAAISRWSPRRRRTTGRHDATHVDPRGIAADCASRSGNASSANR